MGFSLLDSGRGILGRHFLRSVHVSVARECMPLLSATRIEDNMKHANTAVSYTVLTTCIYYLGTEVQLCWLLGGTLLHACNLRMQLSMMV